MISYTPGQTLGRGDLSLFLVDVNEHPVNAFEISYALYYVDHGPPQAEVLIGPPDRAPVNPSVGEYFAALMVPPAAVPGTYRIRWTFKQFAASPEQTVTQELTVAAPHAAQGQIWPEAEADMIRTLRILLRDQNPDKFYHFRPPEHEGRIGQYDKVFGQIWEDAELREYLQLGLDWWNMFPPATYAINTLTIMSNRVPSWRTAVYWAAITHAMFAVSLNWVADEFDYSIGGVSLSLEKSSKYESLKANAEGQFDKATEAKARTVKFIKGLQQPRFGVGVRSAFGPHTGRSILSPRNFV